MLRLGAGSFVWCRPGFLRCQPALERSLHGADRPAKWAGPSVTAKGCLLGSGGQGFHVDKSTYLREHSVRVDLAEGGQQGQLGDHTGVGLGPQHGPRVRRRGPSRESQLLGPVTGQEIQGKAGRREGDMRR